MRKVLVAAAVALGVLIPATAGASTPPNNALVTSVLRIARTEYSLPVTKAVCWTTGPQTFSCQLSGKHIRVNAEGKYVSGHPAPVFS